MNALRHAFSVKFTILLGALLLCLSCPVKSEIKHKLNLPVSLSKVSFFEALACNSFILSAEKKAQHSVTNKTKLFVADANYGITFQKNYVILKQPLGFCLNVLLSFVPIYVLNENYRI